MKKLKICLWAACMLAAVTMQAQRIAVLCDIHVSPDNENSRQLQLAIDEINTGDYDLVVMDGDLTNEGSDTELTYVKALLDGIRHPLCVVPGNHENNWSQSATKTFTDLWGSDRFVTSLGDYDIVGINCGPYMKMGDGHVKQEDLHWLKHTLDSVAGPGRKVISFNHYPVRKDDLDNYIDYGRLLEQYPVVLHVNGHYHRWDRYMAGDIDAVTARALSVDKTFGYTILDFTDGLCTVYEKIIGEAPTVKYVIEERTRHESKLPEAVSMDVEVPGFEIRCVWADTASVFTRLAFDDRCVYFGNSLGEAKAVDKATGMLVWEKTLNTRGVKEGRLPACGKPVDAQAGSLPTLSAPIFSRAVVLPGGKVAFPYSDGIRLIRASDGADLGDLEGSGGPYVADGLLVDTVYLQGGYRHLAAYDANSGRLIWRYDSIGNYCQGAPTVSGDDVVFGAWDTNLRCLSLADGSLKWQWNNGRPNNLLGPGNVVPVVTNDKAIIVAPDRYMTCLDRRNGDMLWRDNSHKYRESLGHSEDMAAAYAKTMDGELVAVDARAAEHRELWICDMGLGYEHAPCIVAEKDGVIYAGSRRGLLTAVSADTHEVLWQAALGSSEINGIDIDPTDGCVWVSLIEGRVCRVSRDER